MRKTALQHFGRDCDFPNVIQGLPTKFSDVEGLEIGSFQTNDGVSLSYWKAGKGTFGNRISRCSADVNDFFTALNIEKAHLCGWSMGASVLWSYII
ncbi:alpha/beta fold hydrolase [Pectobacterium sp. 21LCBS03]|uniref:alpha/beta fold hydrolase n=1 Tax=unclassified Pectobacterium TaxID=2627739 RepID=UPI00200BE4F6|nr:alpha/beta hydrolase [Pectobacterium sp. 21LCBS03]UPY93818.1 alpha/beta hydrolase [Pectobacterium sp. 21LCBS03]